MRSRMGLLLGIGILLLVPSAAQAAPVYTAPPPAGEGSACTESSPCSLAGGLQKVGAGGELIIGSGEYDLGSAHFELKAGAVKVHGAYGAPPPLITGTPGENQFTIAFTGAGTQVEYLDLLATGPVASPFKCGGGVLADRIHSVGAGPVAYGMYVAGCEVRDSVSLGTGPSAIGLFAEGLVSGVPEVGRLRNVTAIGDGDQGAGLYVAALGNPGGEHLPFRLDVSNTIASGSKDILSYGGYASTKVEISHSNFDETSEFNNGTVVEGEGNQTPPPVFADIAANDLREAASSPTIDSGAIDPLLGSTALDGEQRVIGPAPDIGAYETSRPTAPSPLPAPPPPPAAAAAGKIGSLAVAPRAFTPAKSGEAVISRKGNPGATVSFTLDAAGSASFTVERRTVKRAGKAHKPKVSYKPVKGGFSVAGKGGANSFKFSGRIGGKALKPGGYRLVGEAGGASKRATFTIVR